MSWYDESEDEKQRAAEWLTDNFPGNSVEILATFDIAWVAWECDWKGALVTTDGVPELVIVDGISPMGNIPNDLEQKVREYRRLADETEAALRRYRELGGLFGEACQEVLDARHQRVLALERREGETEEDHALRVAARKPGSGVTPEVINTIDLSRRPALAAEVARTETAGELGSNDIPHRHPVDLIGVLARETGADPDELCIKMELSRRLAMRLEHTQISLLEIEGLSDVDAMDIAAVANGDVRLYSVWTIMKLLAATGMDIAIDVFAADPGDGAVYVVEEG